MSVKKNISCPDPTPPFNYFLTILAGNHVQLTESYRDK